MNRRVVYSNHDDRKYNCTTHKIAIAGTNRFLLLTDEMLVDLIDQIAASKGIPNEHQDQ